MVLKTLRGYVMMVVQPFLEVFVQVTRAIAIPDDIVNRANVSFLVFVLKIVSGKSISLPRLCTELDLPLRTLMD